jgi:hypothetical protein
MLLFFVSKFMEFNSYEGWTISVCMNTTLFLLGTKVSFFYKIQPFCLFSEKSTLYACITCCMFPQVNHIFVSNVFYWRQIFFMFYVLPIMDVYFFLLSVSSFYPLLSYLWDNMVLCSPAAVGILVVTLGKWHVMFCIWYILSDSCEVCIGS